MVFCWCIYLLCLKIKTSQNDCWFRSFRRWRIISRLSKPVKVLWGDLFFEKKDVALRNRQVLSWRNWRTSSRIYKKLKSLIQKWRFLIYQRLPQSSNKIISSHFMLECIWSQKSGARRSDSARTWWVFLAVFLYIFEPKYLCQIGSKFDSSQGGYHGTNFRISYVLSQCLFSKTLSCFNV